MACGSLSPRRAALDTASDEGKAMGVPRCCSERGSSLLRNDVSLEKGIPWGLLKCNTTVNDFSRKNGGKVAYDESDSQALRQTLKPAHLALQADCSLLMDW